MSDRLLFHDEKVVSLTPKAADTLFFLLSEPGHIVDKQELLRKVWPDSFVEEGSLTRNISQLRKVLGDDPDGTRFIETIPRRGYRFTAEVKEIVEEEAVVPAAQTPAPPDRRRGITIAATVASAIIVLAAGIGLLRTRGPERGTRMEIVPFTTSVGGEYEPAFSPDGNRIAYVWSGPKENDYRIYVKMITGGNAVRLSARLGGQGSPTWSPDGNEIGFVRYGTGEESGVYVVSALGGAERKVTPVFYVAHIFDRHLDWSPDGKLLAFCDKTSAEAPFRIYVVRPDAGGRRAITSPPPQSAGDTGPAFSPDGRTIAFKRTMGSGESEIYLVPVAGGKPTRLTSDNRQISAHAWSQDGRSVLVVSNRRGTKMLWRIPVNGGSPEAIPGIGEGATSMGVSRSGHRLAFSQWFADTNIWAKSIVSAEPPKEVIASTRTDTSPQVSPDGSKVAFRTDRSGHTEIWVADSSGADPLQLTSFRGPLTGSPHWSPDGKYLAFDSRPGSNSDIFVIPSTGGEARQLTSGPFDNVVPSWSADGASIYFASNRTGDWQIWKLLVASPSSATQITKEGGFAAAESADGKFLYHARGPNSPGLYRLSLADAKDEVVIPDLKVGFWGCWGLARNGLYYVDLSPDPGALVQRFDPTTRQTSNVARLPGTPPFGDAGFSVAPDGSQIYYTQTDHSGSDIMLVENFR